MILVRGHSRMASEAETLCMVKSNSKRSLLNIVSSKKTKNSRSKK